MTTERRTALFLLLVASIALVITACDRTAPTQTEMIPTAAGGLDLEPAAAPAGSNAAHGTFYPLEIGNRWHYARTDRFQLIEGGVPQPPETYTGTVTEEHTQYETLFGREYVVAERHTVIPDLSADDTEWIRYRQDRQGLYEAAVSITQPPGSPASVWRSLFQPVGMTPPPPASLVAAVGEERAGEVWPELWSRYRLARAALSRGATPPQSPPGGVLTEEVVRLDYPLHPGSSWNILEAPLFTAAVEAREMLELAGERIPAWRTRLWNESMGPDDRVLIWYSRRGTLRSSFHFEAVLTDPAGNVLGTYLFDTEEVLDGMDVAGPGSARRGP